MEAIWDILYGFLIVIDTGIYKLVGWLYQLYLLISSARIFRTETFEAFISRIYVILGIVMLFFLAYSLLSSIVDPDNLTKGESSVGKIITNTVISIVIITILPTIFNFLYYAQEVILKENFIGKIVLGNYSSATNTLEVTFDEDICKKMEELEDEFSNPYVTSSGPCKRTYHGDGDANSVKLAGNNIAVDIFSAFYYPSLSDDPDDENEGSYNSYIEKARQQAADNGADADSYADANQFYNRIFTYDILKDANQDFSGNGKDLKDGEGYLYEVIASYNPCHTMSDAYAYGSVAQDCADDIMAYHALIDKDWKALPLDYKSILQYAKTTGHFDGFRLLSRTVHDGYMEYTVLFSTVAGIFVLYIMISYCIDMGLRAAKLGFAQLIAPVPILARILPNRKGMYDSWFKFTLNAYFEVFLRLIVIFLGIFMITNLPSLNHLWDNSIFFNRALMSIKVPLLMDIDASWGVVVFARIAVIIGILMFVKQAPQLIQQAIGIQVNTGSLNIRNKIRDGMIGGKAITGGVDKVASLAGKGAGAATGYMGARMAAKNNMKGLTDENGQPLSDERKKQILAAAGRNGARTGWKGGGEQYRNAYQSTYADLTGDHKYKGSYFHGGKTFMEERREADSRAYKEANKQYGEMLKPLISHYNDLIQQQANRLSAANQQVVDNYESSSRFNQAQNNNKKKIASEWASSNEGKAVSDKIKAYEQSAEYQNMKQEESKYNAEGTEAFKAAMEDAIKKANTESSKEYLEARKKQDEFNASLDEKARKATMDEFKGMYADYKKAKEETDELISQKAKEIVASQDKKGFERYERALSENSNRGDFSDSKKFEDSLRSVFEKYNGGKK